MNINTSIIRSLRPRGRLVLRPRGRDPTWRVSSRTWESVLERPPELPLPRLSSTRSAKLRLIPNKDDMLGVFDRNPLISRLLNSAVIWKRPTSNRRPLLSA